MLRIRNLDAGYTNLKVLRRISIHVRAGEIVTIIGANGAGKTTLLKTIAGLIKPANGEILFDRHDITRLSPEKIVFLGCSLVPEGRQVFAPMSVKENLQLGGYVQYRRKRGSEVAADLGRVFELFPRLKEREDQLAGTLSGGEQQMLAMGRALMASPRIILLDEPSMGLAPMLVETIFDIVREINQRGTTVLLVEQNARMALAVAHRGYVIETGNIALEGPASELLENPRVKESYLGENPAPPA